MLTLAEYLQDYSSDETKKLGYNLIEKELNNLPEGERKQSIIAKLEAIKTGKRDLLF
ncbi:MAG: hypothetical protein RR770_01300 [Bacteroidales bacterium]